MTGAELHEPEPSHPSGSGPRPDVGAGLVSASPVIDLATLVQAVETLRGMAYEHRLHMLVVLRDGEATPSTLAEAIAAPPTAVSHHLRHLLDAGLIRRRRRGRQVFYQLSGDATSRLIDEVLRYVHG